MRIDRRPLALDDEMTTMIARRIGALLAVVQLESNGTPIEIDGFRLRGVAPDGDAPRLDRKHVDG